MEGGAHNERCSLPAQIEAALEGTCRSAGHYQYAQGKAMEQIQLVEFFTSNKCQ